MTEKQKALVRNTYQSYFQVMKAKTLQFHYQELLQKKVIIHILSIYPFEIIQKCMQLLNTSKLLQIYIGMHQKDKER